MAITQPSLRPLDLGIALYLGLGHDQRYDAMAAMLDISVSQAHRSVARLDRAGLMIPESRVPERNALIEFLVHGIRYAFFPVLGPEARGVPTAHSAPPLELEITGEGAVVWPSVRGEVRGMSLVPLFPGAVHSKERAHDLYHALALVDALRIGRSRERKRAEELLRKMLQWLS